ncbi:MAG: NADP-dependent oxidoreductase [Sphingomonas sp.]
MRAIVINAYGGPEVLEQVTLAPPIPASGETLVRIHAIAVNPADTKWRAGMFAGFAPVPFPHVLGYDIAGIVIGGDGWAPGTRVFGMLDPITKGGYAEQVTIASALLAEIPASLDYPAAAAIPTAGLTGLQMIEDALDVRSGQRILITGAPGAVGRVALHTAQRRGATVIAAVRSAQRDEALALGANEAIILEDGAFTGAPFDHVVDTVGGQAVGRLCRHLKGGGRIVTAATTSIPADGLPASPEFFAVRADAAQLARLAAEVTGGAIAMRVAHVMPLANAAEAHRLIEVGRVRGKIILQP